MHRVRILPGLLGLALLAAACWQKAPAPRTFEVVRTSPALGRESEPLLLNDSITVYFSDTIHPLSVTPDSVTLVDEDGHQVPGALRVGANWVTFQPEPPLTRELTDGSFRPGATYHLCVAGYPRHDAVRAADGRRLALALAYEVRVAGLSPPFGLPAPLRPPASELPFVLRSQEAPQQLPADAPRLRLHFTLPVLPTSAVAEAFEITLLRNPLETLTPRSVRVVTSRLDEFPGSTVEIDLGSLPRRQNGSTTLSLQADDLISVQFGPSTLKDYAGNLALPSSPSYWSVVLGSSLPLAEWPSGDDNIVGDDPMLPGFEVRAGVMRPRVRIEAGDGSLGVFRPQRDTTLRPGEPFDRGDGQQVTSRGRQFAFLAVDIKAGVSVFVDAGSGPVQILSCGDLRIAGSLELVGPTQPMQARPFQTAPVRDLLDAASVGMLAAGNVDVRGTVKTRLPVPTENTALTLATAGRMHLAGELPFNTVLVYEAAAADSDRPVRGVLGQSRVVPATFTYGVERGAAFVVRGFTSWRQLPWDRDGGVVRVVDADADLKVGWQAAPADAVRKNEPDLRRGRVGRTQPIADQDRIAVEVGAFVRFELEARTDRRPPPSVRELRIVDR